MAGDRIADLNSPIGKAALKSKYQKGFRDALEAAGRVCEDMKDPAEAARFGALFDAATRIRALAPDAE